MKKWIAVLLALCMVVTMTPAIAFGAQGTQSADQGQVAAQETQNDQSVDQQVPETADPEEQGDVIETDPPAAGDQQDVDQQDVNPKDGSALKSNKDGVGEGEVPRPAEDAELTLQAVKNGWYQEDGGFRYYTNGTFLTGLQDLQKGKYYFGADGLMEKGFKDIGGARYFFNTANGSPLSTNAGVMLKGWQTIQGQRYYLDPVSGKMTKGWRTIGSYRYFFNPSDGRMLKGWQTIGGKRYYLNNSSGAAMTGWQTIGGKRYYLNPSAGGAAAKGWLTLNGVKYYMDPSTGAMTVGWRHISGKRYYFTKSGRVQKGGWATISKKTYYFEKAGYVHTGWLKKGKKKYYCNTKTGALAKGWVKVGKYKFYMNPKTGVMKTGWLKLNGNKYYLNKKSGAMYTGLKKIKKDRYYFDSEGVMQTGAVKTSSSTMYYFMKNGKAVKKIGWFRGNDGKKRYCISKKGKIAFGKKKINGVWYIFSSTNGRLMSTLGDDIDVAISDEYSPTSYLVVVKKSSHVVRIYRGSQEKWKKSRSFSCATGSSTPKGRWSIGDKQEYMDTSDTCRVWYVSTFNGRIKFHSVLYAKDDQPLKVIDDRLGVTITDGCVRLSLDNARYIYNNIPSSTRVVVL